MREVTFKWDYYVIFELTDHSTEHSEKPQGTLTASDGMQNVLCMGQGLREEAGSLSIMNEGASRTELTQL